MPSHSLDVLRQLSPRVPAASVLRMETWGAADVAVAAAPSASVILLRNGPAGLETYLLHRHARMPFAASAVVFPGGRVDPGDADGGADPVRACALRETREETSVALTDADLLPWAHWTTPEPEPRRFDTHFYVAALPAGQQARDVSGETDRADWSTPAAALKDYRSGDIALLPPTLSLLLELADVDDVAAVVELARDRTVEPVLPRLTRSGDGWSYRYPARR